ncbi:putative ribosomal protein S26e [Helianthus annuus]|nr:putative ribosomal protein S26e [Helianthus annuus]
MIFGGPLVKTETAEEADELMRVDEKASELLVAVADKWDSHVLVMDKVAPQNWKMFKQRNVRRNKHARGHVKFIRCSNCGKCCPKVSQRRCLCCYFHCWWTWCSQCYCGCLQILHHTIELPDLSQELRCFQTVTCYQVLEKKDAASLSASIFQEK